MSLPLKAAGFSSARAIWYGQLSGLVEPVAGVLGALLVTFVVPILPYALAFAAGAMVYVVVDDIVPEAQSQLVLTPINATEVSFNAKILSVVTGK